MSQLCTFKRSMLWQKLLLLLFTQGNSVIWSLEFWLLLSRSLGRGGAFHQIPVVELKGEKCVTHKGRQPKSKINHPQVGEVEG